MIGRRRRRRPHRVIGLGRVCGVRFAHRIAQLGLRRLRSACDLRDPAAQLHLLDVRARVRATLLQPVGLVFSQRHRNKHTVAPLHRSKLPGFGIAGIDVADVARVVSKLKLAQPVSLRNQLAQPG